MSYQFNISEHTDVTYISKYTCIISTLYLHVISKYGRIFDICWV